MKSRTLVGGIFALCWLTALPAWAVEYRLQVANIDDQIFASYEGKARSWTDMKEPMGGLAARLDDNQFSRDAGALGCLEQERSRVDYPDAAYAPN